MKIPKWIEFDAQSGRVGRHSWNIARLTTLARNLPVMEVPLDHLYLWHTYEKLTLRQMVMHMQAVMAADLAFPIILDEDGEIIDGRHRLMKAMFLGHATIKAVRFDENPSPDRVEES